MCSEMMYFHFLYTWEMKEKKTFAIVFAVDSLHL